MTENNKTDLRPQSPISWFPGHMKKTRDYIQNVISNIDIVFEIIDSRMPMSSKIVDIKNLIHNKDVVLIFNKYDLCDKEETNKWIKRYEEEGYTVLPMNLTNNKDVNKLTPLINEVRNRINVNREKKGLKPIILKGMVVGVPNVGKSTLINLLANKKVASASNRPGVTQTPVWLNTKHNMQILDTPGILWPRLEGDVGYNLAAFASIKTEILNKEDIVLYSLNKLIKHYYYILNDLYNIQSTNDVYNILNKIGEHTGSYLKNKEINYDKVYDIILNDLRTGKIKNITFDRN